MRKECCICGKAFTVDLKRSIIRKTCSVECRQKLIIQTNSANPNERQCSRCKEILKLEDFVQFKKRNTIRYTYCKKCWNEITREHKRSRKINLIEAHGGKCRFCGYDRCPNALEFHHIHPENKDFGISEKYGRKAMSEEAKKCILICSNCHRELHDGMISL